MGIGNWLHRDFNGFETALVERFKLNAEEHSGDVGEDEGSILLYHDVLHVAHLVVADEHIAFGGYVHELRAGLVVEGAEFQLAVGAFNGLLSVLGVVRYAAVGEQIAFVVLVDEVLRAVEIEVLGAEARVERKEDFLSDVNGVGRSNRVGELHVVAFLGGDGTCGDFLFSNRVEAVEEVGGGVTGGVALAVPYGIVQMLGEVLGDTGQDVASRRGCHLTVALCGTCAKKGRYSRVRLEVGDNGAEERFEVSELDAEIVVHGTLGIVGGELSVACQVADTLLVSDAGATRHVLEGVADSDNGEHEEVGAVFDGGLLILFESELKFSSHIFGNWELRIGD